MRAVWSLWTKPFREGLGWSWFSEKHHLLGWVLSVETAKKHFSETSLFTDDKGARLLVDGIGLEFDYVSTELNQLDTCDPGWWALGKVYTYRAQTEPFIHLDNDVFLWKRLPDRLESASLLVQNPEYFAAGNFFYRPEKLEQALTRTGQGWLPPEWVWYRTCGAPQRGECCGIFGGNRVDFISHYADLAMKLVGHPLNQQGLSLLHNKMEHTVLFEQYLLSACIEYHRNKADSPYNDIDIQYLFHSMDDAFNPDSATRLGFTHLIGDAKRNRVIADSLEKKVKKDYPAQYERCLQYLQQSSR